MTKQEKAIERLARDICWAEFHIPTLAGCTKLQYWDKVTEHKKREYEEEAARFLYLVRRLGLKRIEAALANTLIGFGDLS